MQKSGASTQSEMIAHSVTLASVGLNSEELLEGGDKAVVSWPGEFTPCGER
jgi:hypothetical protein